MNKPHKLCSYSPEPHTEVYCFRLDFNLSKLFYLKEIAMPVVAYLFLVQYNISTATWNKIEMLAQKK